MLRVAEHVERTDTGRQRRANEDAYFARSPLFAVADGMGGAQAGEVASQMAVTALEPGLPDGPAPAEERLAVLARDANAAIHALSRSAEGAVGMGTTLTAAYVDGERLALAHVGDSRAYRLRAGALEQLSQDHSLVEELVRQGKLTHEEADRHPQRSIITRALGPEDEVEVDHQSWPAQAGDVYLLCSDGLTSMVPQARVGDLLRGAATLQAAARALIDAANAAGGKDNITVLLFRLEEVPGTQTPAPDAASAAVEEPTTIGAPAVTVTDAPLPPAPPPATDVAIAPVAARLPRAPAPAVKRRRRHPRLRRAGIVVIVLAVIAVPVAIGLRLALRSVYFIGTNARGYVTVYRGVPYDLPGGAHLYTTQFVSDVAAPSVARPRLRKLLDHSLRSRHDALSLVRQLELGRLAQ
jgi:serine/threonine protein phosphatase PrpC